MTKTIAVLTSGGDAPGMNAAIRAIVRVAISKGLNVYGVYRGLQGLIDDEFAPMNARSVSNIIQRGGTILHTSRSEEFMKLEGRKKAAHNLEKHKIDGLLAIGGDGTFHGLLELGKVWDGSIIGIPGTIDNDLYGTDFTIGFDTAVNTALDLIDKIRDTAESHERFFLVEVMGRWAGYIALAVAIAGGAEHVILPEQDNKTWKEVAEELEEGRKKGKKSGIVVVSEQGKEGATYKIAEEMEQYTSINFKVTILGHVQRGGDPTANDRILATKLGAFAVESFLAGKSGVMVGQINKELITVPLEDTWTKKDKKPLDKFLLDLIEPLAI